jgi:uncharacterized protein (TIGR02246 family)
MEISNQADAMSRPEGGSAAGIDALIEAWARAWNAHDMQAAAALVHDDVDFVTVAGLWLRGRDEFATRMERRAHPARVSSRGSLRGPRGPG